MALPDALQTTFSPLSLEAAWTSQLSWLLIGCATLLFVVVMALAFTALRARPRWLAGERAVVAGGIVVPVVLLTILLIYAPRQGAILARDDAPALRVEVTGHQWWWRVRYLDAGGAPDFETANEIRLPVGQKVELALRSADVLHSFWVPNLAGKLDMIPGRTNRLSFTPQVAATARGQCAEYCGGPHAQMALYVVTVPNETFDRWRASQRAPASRADATFEARCATCHAIRGSRALGTSGPDLTHVGSRLSIGAGTLPADAGGLARWIASSQHIKPGNLMPAFTEFSAEELSALSTYLASLQ
jgi:cytochrome c oxidase subunit II